MTSLVLTVTVAGESCDDANHVYGGDMAELNDSGDSNSAGAAISATISLVLTGASVGRCGNGGKQDHELAVAAQNVSMTRATSRRTVISAGTARRQVKIL